MHMHWWTWLLLVLVVAWLIFTLLEIVSTASNKKLSRKKKIEKIVDVAVNLVAMLIPW